MNDKTIMFMPSGRGKAQCEPDPRYPDGIHIPAPKGSTKTCKVALPYPAPECGMFSIDCSTCGFSMLITAAGRADDPVSAEIPCMPLVVQ